MASSTFVHRSKETFDKIVNITGGGKLFPR